MAPELNFAPLVWRRTTDTEKLLNIQLGDPDPKLFLPPPEAEANMLDCPEPMIASLPRPPTAMAQVSGPTGPVERKCLRRGAEPAPASAEPKPGSHP